MAFTDRLHNRGSISTGYDIDNSCKFESGGNEYIDRPVGGSDGSSTQHTISCWIKRTELGIDSEPVSAAGIGRFRFESNDTFSYQFRSGKEIITNRIFRDTSAWYHIVAVSDSSQSTASNRMKLYVNGVQETSFGTANYQDQNQASPGWGKYSTYNFTVGAATNATRNFNGYLAEVYYIDGQVLDPTYFGEFDDTGIWKPKEFSGTFGSLDTYLDFSNASDLGENSGGTTDLNENGVDSSNQATDTPTNNFATLNPLYLTARYTITEGGTTQVSSANGWGTSVGSVGVTSGKWYFEIKTPDSNGYTTFGAIDADSLLNQYLNGDAHAGDAPYGISYYGGNGGIIVNGSYISGTSFPSYNTQIMGCALDLDNNKIYFSKSGTYGNSGNPVTGANGMALPTGGSGTWFFSTSTYSQPLDTNHGGYTSFTISSAESDADGYGSFEYAPPTGYYALCTKNLAEYG